MKKLYIFLTGCLFLSLTVNANNTNNRNAHQTPFIFIENGIEYAVFNNGEFDFNIIQRPTTNINIHTRIGNLSFNTGRDYEPYIQTNRYGAIIQIERTPIFYNRYGKVNRIGSININYNYQGLVSSIGNLNIYYTNYGTVYNRRGYINRLNINYRPCYQSYKRPIRSRAVTYTRPRKQKNIVNRYYNSRKHNNNYSNKKNRNYNFSKNNNNSVKKGNNKSSNKYTSKNKTSANSKVKKQKRNKKESYRGNSNSYRRTSKSNDSQYASTDYKKR